MELFEILRLLLILFLVNKGCPFCISPSAEPINPASDCKQFNTYILQSSIYFQSNTAFHFLPGIHVVQSSLLTVNQVNNVSFIGNVAQDWPNGTIHWDTIIECRNSSGFIFNGTTNLTIKNLTFIGCTIQHQYTNSSLVFTNVSDVLIDNISIQNSPGYGIFVSKASGNFSIQKSLFFNISNSAIYSMNSEVTISTSVFIVQNSVGVIVINATSFFHSSVFSGSLLGVGVHSEYSKLYIYDTIFENMGTGLEMSHNSHSVISSSTFSSIKNGINEVASIDTMIEFCNFIKMGSAVQTTNSNYLFVHSCKFLEIIIIGVYAHKGLNVTISDVVFDGGQVSSTVFNIGVIAAEMENVYVNSSKFSSVSWGIALSDVHSTITSSNFSNNENAGFFQLGEVNITDCLFTNYNNSGIFATSTLIAISGNTSFLNGQSLDDGGALYLSNTVVTFVAPTIVTFVNNSALLKGGAIYADSLSQPNRITDLNDSQFFSLPCFLQFYDPYGTFANPNIRIYFANNYAPDSGSTIYGLGFECHADGSFVPNYLSEDMLTPINILKVVSNLGIIDSRQFASDPFTVCVVDKGQNQCPPTSLADYNFSLYPGQTKNVTFVTIDEYNGSTPAIVYVHSVATFAVVDVFRTKNTPLVYNLPSQMKQGSSTFLFMTEAVIRNFMRGQRSTVLSITVQTLPCPFGFTLNNESKVCICDPFLQSQPPISCNITDVRIYSPLQSWIGNISDGRLAYYEFCSYELCAGTESVQLNHQDDQCRNNRSGVMCGSCQTNLSEVFGKPQCMKCSNWYLFLIVPFAIMGVVLVALLLSINLTVSNGVIDGFIFYANVVKLNSSYFLPITVSNAFTNILSTLVAWLNLDLGIVTCFYDGMSVYGKVWFQFIFPAYILSLVGVIIVVGRYSTTVSKLCRYSVVPVLATLVLLCFTKLLSNVIIIFSAAYISVEGEGEEFQSVWQYNGNVAFFSKSHIPLAVVGLVVIIFFIAPYILLMLFSPCLRKVSHLKVVSWINTLKPFLDCYEAPFLPRHRFWTGILLIARVIISVAKALNLSGKEGFNMFITIVVVLCLLVYLTRFGVYKSWVICTIEMFLYINLILLSLFRLLFQNIFLSNKQSKTALTITYSLGVGSSVMIFFGIIVHRVYDLIRKFKGASASFAEDNADNAQSDSAKIDTHYDLFELKPEDQLSNMNIETTHDSQYREVLLSIN